jgi:hypothetical protein
LPVVATKGPVFSNLHRQEPVFCKINWPIAYIFIFSLVNIRLNGIHIGTNCLKKMYENLLEITPITFFYQNPNGVVAQYRLRLSFPT